MTLRAKKLEPEAACECAGPRASESADSDSVVPSARRRRMKRTCESFTARPSITASIREEQYYPTQILSGNPGKERACSEQVDTATTHCGGVHASVFCAWIRRSAMMKKLSFRRRGGRVTARNDASIVRPRGRATRRLSSSHHRPQTSRCRASHPLLSPFDFTFRPVFAAPYSCEAQWEAENAERKQQTRNWVTGPVSTHALHTGYELYLKM